MKLPSQVTILGEVFKVIREESIPNYPHAMGLCDVENKKIHVLKKLPPKEAKIVLIHEVIHAVIGTGGIYQVLSHDIEEILCDQVSRTLSKLL